MTSTNQSRLARTVQDHTAMPYQTALQAVRECAQQQSLCLPLDDHPRTNMLHVALHHRDGELSPKFAQARSRSAPCPCNGCELKTADGQCEWPEHSGPALCLRQYHHLPSGYLPRWVDHAYRLFDSSVPGGVIYVAEPYSLSEEATADLSWLALDGWLSQVDPSTARHYPGRTTHIRIRNRLRI